MKKLKLALVTLSLVAVTACSSFNQPKHCSHGFSSFLGSNDCGELRPVNGGW
ncbi:MAG: hypothetical protein HN790_05475 [Methylococcales bacterium]|nr:hypothetical protein [Methylococcales bacterium]